MDQEKVIVIDFGGQYNQLVARRVRECNVYCEIYSYKTDLEQIKAMNPKGIILTGGPNSCYEADSPTYQKELFELGIPVLGLCYGALWRADKLQSKAAKAGFEFADVSGALDKLDEETRELREAAERGTNFSEELGDVLFAAVKAGRFLNVDPEDALNATCEKFIARFRRVEEACAARGAEMSSLPLDELTRLWNEAKHPTE